MKSDHTPSLINNSSLTDDPEVNKAFHLVHDYLSSTSTPKEYFIFFSCLSDQHIDAQNFINDYVNNMKNEASKMGEDKIAANILNMRADAVSLLLNKAKANPNIATFLKNMAIMYGPDAEAVTDFTISNAEQLLSKAANDQGECRII